MKFEDAIKKILQEYWKDDSEFFSDEGSALHKVSKTKYTKEYFKQYEAPKDEESFDPAKGKTVTKKDRPIAK